MFRVRFSCHSRFSLPLFHIFCHVTPTLSGTFTKSKYKRFFRGLRDVCIAVAIESCARDSSPLFCHQWNGDRWTREFKKWRKRSCLRFLTLFDTDTLTQIYVVALTALLLKNSFKTFFCLSVSGLRLLCFPPTVMSPKVGSRYETFHILIIWTIWIYYIYFERLTSWRDDLTTINCKSITISCVGANSDTYTVLLFRQWGWWFEINPDYQALFSAL